jgi:hypothetical protein
MHWLFLSTVFLLGLSTAFAGFTTYRKKKAGLSAPYVGKWAVAAVIFLAIAVCIFAILGKSVV